MLLYEICLSSNLRQYGAAEKEEETVYWGAGRGGVAVVVYLCAVVGYCLMRLSSCQFPYYE